MVEDWKLFEQTWCDAIIEGIVEAAMAHPREQFYAGAIWLLYGDYSSILPPAFGLNVESADRVSRWHPPDWRWAQLDLVQQRVRPLYASLASLDLDDDGFDALWDRHVEALTSASRDATELVRTGRVRVSKASFTSTFFVGIIDFSQDDAEELLRRSVDEQVLADSGILETLTS